ncbi:MAG: peptide-methionine (S)-S-oxide reductase [Desulfobacterales bacterium]|nr:peptide-methionine (S)-S-oxide reductase [Desulfobacterales bacterium]
MIRTRVGYAGGDTPAPTYRSMGDHTETVRIDYDPEKISFRQLLDIFWESHNYTYRTSMTQYKNAVFFHNTAQQQQALESKDALEQRSGKKVMTDIVPVKSFTLAEAYHQKYLLKQSQLRHALDTYYANHPDFVNSTAASRLNGYAGRNGTREQLLREIDSLGVNTRSRQLLMNLVPE